MWQDGQEIVIGTLGGEASAAEDINNLDQVIGTSEFDPEQRYYDHAFHWRDGELIDLHSFEGRQSWAYGINDAGQIVGAAQTATDQRAILWEPDGTVVDLGWLGGVPSSTAWAINDLGQVVGTSAWRPSGVTDLHAFFWEDGVMRDLHEDDRFFDSVVRGINNLGQMVGEYFDPEDPFFPVDSYAAIWLSPDGPSVAMETLLPPNSRWAFDFFFLEDINDAGQIAGWGWHHVPDLGGFHERGFLITPVEHEFALSGVAPGIAGQVNGIRASGLDPGERVYFLYSQRGGGTVLPMCEILDATLQLDYPQVITSVVADANGEALLLVEVPNAARARGDILIQAVVPSSCKLSELRVVRFE
ncbi:MAG: hypothetical protein ACF8PN_00625 [Phycisphaerales bacterium]